MKLLLKTFFGTGLVLGLTTLGLSGQTSMNLGRLPLHFEAIEGNQSFLARGSSSEFLISPTESRFILCKTNGETAFASMVLGSANASAHIEGMAELPGKANYLIGNKPELWQTSVPLFSHVRVSDLYPGVSVVYYGNEQQLEYDFNLAAGANPDLIKLQFKGAQQVKVSSHGELVVSLNGGEVIQHTPVAYQTINGVRQEVAAGYKILDDHTAAFSLGSYNHTEPLVIDPILSFATYFGGNNSQIAHAVALDKSGNIYIAGETLSTAISNGVPFSTIGAYQTNFHGGTYAGDAFVAEFDNTGSNLVYCTYIGGSSEDRAFAIAIDKNGNAYIAGKTYSSDFPTTNPIFGYKPGLFPGYYGFAFITELKSGGSNLVYSTFLSGYLADAGTAIAVDTNCNTYVAGYTCYTGFPTTANAHQPNLACPPNFYYNRNAFVAEIAPNGTSLNYCSYLGGTNYDQAMGIAVDTNGYIYVTGFTASTNFPTINGLTNYTQLNGSNSAPLTYDAFVCKFYPHFTNAVYGTNMTNWAQYSTLLGGSSSDQATGIATDGSGNAYVAGFTTSFDFPNTTNAPAGLSSFVSQNSGGTIFVTNAFLAKIQWNGTNNYLGNAILGFSTPFGGTSNDVANGVALDASGNVFVVGSTTSTNFPATTNNLFGSLSSTNSGICNAFVTALSGNGSNLIYSTYLGGNNLDYGNAIATDTAGNAYVVGQTYSTNFPTYSATQNTLNGTSDAFLAKILPQSPPVLTANLKTNVLSLSWPMIGQATTNYLGLQASTNLLGTNWAFSSQSPVLTNSAYVYTVATTNPAQFFRLHLK